MDLLLVPESFGVQLILGGLYEQLVVSFHPSSELPVILLDVLLRPNEFSHHFIDKLHPLINLILDQVDLLLHKSHQLLSRYGTNSCFGLERSRHSLNGCIETLAECCDCLISLDVSLVDLLFVSLFSVHQFLFESVLLVF